MKFFAKILLLNIFLLGSTQLIQFLKLPILVHHFMEHKQENENITLWHFLKMHYENSDVMDSDYDKDMKLPFKSCENNYFSIYTICESTLCNFSIFPQNKPKKQLGLSIDSDFSTAYLSSIWQPPQFS